MPKIREIERSNSKKTPGQMGRQKDRQTLFHRILPTTAGRLTSASAVNKTAVDWHLKVKHVEYNVVSTKNHCIIVSTENNQLKS